MSVNAGFAELSTPRLWIGMAIFVLGTATAAFAPWRRVAVGALVVVVAYSVFNVLRSAAALIAAGGWSPPA